MSTGKVAGQYRKPREDIPRGFLLKRRDSFRELLFRFFLAGFRSDFLAGGHVAVAAVGLV